MFGGGLGHLLSSEGARMALLEWAVLALCLIFVVAREKRGRNNRANIAADAIASILPCNVVYSLRFTQPRSVVTAMPSKLLDPSDHPHYTEE